VKKILIGQVEVALEDYAVGASAVLGIRDSGKTVTSKGICEQLIEHGVQPIIFDAVGKWRWMKVAGPGPNGKAYKVVVAGGREPDLPLTPHSVSEIVRAALRERIPLVVDLFSKTMSKADWRRIVQTAIHIIHYENEGGAVHVFLEEAAEFVPQKIYDGETYAEVEKLVRMGGNASVGITLINQRSQEINKAVLDNCSTALVLGCQVGKNAILAVESWIEKLDAETAKEVTTSLPKLKAGEAWVWTRKSLTHPTREQMPMCRSFHPDRRTPEIILKSVKPTDTAEFVSKMAASIPKVIEEAKANDPAELKRRIRELEKQLSAQPKQVTQAAVEKIKEVAVFTPSERTRLTKLVNGLERIYATALRFEAVKEDITFFKTRLSSAGVQAPRVIHHRQIQSINVRPTSAPSRITNQRISSPDGEPQTNGQLPHGEEKILSACIQFPDGLKREQITVLTGFKRSTRDAYVYRLSTKGLVKDAGGLIVATHEGIAVMPNAEPLPTGDDLQKHWRQRLPSGERQLFGHIISAYPNSISREQLSELTGFKRSTRDAYLYRMKAKILFSEHAGEIRASNTLF
jgi:hypothetical protein